jgi:hypothetical protein
MASFGQLLRKHRRQCRDPQRGGPLTQDRLGELLGQMLGDAGYSGAAVSEWERDKSKIDEDNRLVLVGLIETLHQHGGLASAAEANALLHAGNYRALDAAEGGRLFPDQAPEPSSEQEFDAVDRPAARPISKERRKQLILLDKVRSFWIEGVLEKAAPDRDDMAPHFRLASDSVVQPWEGILEPAVLAERLKGRESPLALYQEGDRSLLILGEPGAGKTMMLLSLAKALAEQAEHDPSLPVPVVLNLITWVKRRGSLEAWAVEELTAKYMIPRRTGRKWLADDDLVLLLDGLDDVPKRWRRRCALAINAFRASHGLCGIAVCSRSKEYAATGVKLKLGTAVELRPLSDGQIDRYLAVKQESLASLRQAFERDETLQAMARNPLMLSIMSLAYDDGQPAPAAGGTRDALDGPARHSTRRARLFDTYVNSMYHRKVAGTKFPADQMTDWLSWLARQMIRFQQSPLLLEQIQPSWLPDRAWRRLYMALSGLIAGLYTALIIWLLLQILSLPTPDVKPKTAVWVASTLGVSHLVAEAIALIALNLLLGLVFTVLQGRYFEATRRLADEPEISSWLYRGHIATVALITGGLTFVLGIIHDPPQFALGWATAEGFIFAIITRFVFGLSYKSEIRTVEALGWSWPSALRGFLVGLAAAATFEVLDFLIFKDDAVTLSVMIPTAGGLVLGGLRGRRVEAKSRPNQGIVLSLRNSFIAATLSGVILAALAFYVRKEAYAADYALRTGILTFLIAGALFGGGNVIKHYLVRLLLWLHKDLPWNMVRFLDDAADLIFLRKVGGGYIFVHRLLQQYFASLHRSRQEGGPDPVRLATDQRQMAGGSGSS